MEEIQLPILIIKEKKLTINEYLVLYNIVNNYVISDYLENVNSSIISLEKKGFIKIKNNTLFLREKANELFNPEEDLFEVWLNIYPTMVKKRNGGKRALSPSKVNTVLGRRLKKKWDMIFKKDIKSMQNAIEVLKCMIKNMEKSGDLEFMVEATRWLNEGYHEKYSFLLEEDVDETYTNEDYM